ncbi:MAG: hypothetical protein HQ564_02205 [Candidatus Saganbacteria bacterium]|nr:hypothetical protein [Candidatus Saganbacteria bacterium]
MTNFDNQSFQKTKFSKEQLENHLNSAKRDVEIADKSDIPEVVFKFSYDALLKIGIYLIAKEGYKVKSGFGHHIKILEKLAETLKDENIAILGNKMRQDRNVGLYAGGLSVSQKENEEYLKLTKSVLAKAKNL